MEKEILNSHRQLFCRRWMRPNQKRKPKITAAVAKPARDFNLARLLYNVAIIGGNKAKALP